MAGNAVIGALRVNLGLDTAQFSEGLKKAQGGLAKFASVAKAGAAVILTTLVATASAVAVAVKGMIDEADKMSKMSQQIGIPIDELSKLKYAAELSDVSLEQLGKGVKRLSANMLDIAQGGVGPAAKAFRMLGINAQDAEGNLRPATDVIGDLADKFVTMKDGATKTALAMNIFGKSGADLIPLLNGGGDALRQMYQEADELGLVLDEKTGKAAEAFNDNLTRLGKIGEGITNKIGAGLLPALEQISTALVGASKNTAFMSTVSNVLAVTLKALVTAAVVAGYAVSAIGLTIVGVGKAIARITKGDFAGAADAMDEAKVKMQTIGRGADDMVKALWSAPPAASATAKAVTGAGVAVQGLAKSTDKATKATKEQTDAERERQRVLDDGARLTEQLRTAEEAFADEKARNNKLLDAGAISLETYNRAMAKATNTYEDFIAARNKSAQENPDVWGVGDMLAELGKADAARVKASAEAAADLKRDLQNATFDGIAGGLYAAADGDLGKYLASALKRNLIEGLAHSLTGLLSTLSDGKAGGGVLQKIGSFFAGVPGFATGGSFKVGGSGGVDSQLTMMRTTPGEMVDIRRPGQERDSGGGTEVVVTPSKYFDVQVQKVARPIVDAGIRQAVATSTNLARRGAPAMQSQQRRLGTTT